MKSIGLGAIFFASFACFAADPQWLEITRSKDGEAFFIDINSVKTSGQIATAWFKSESNAQIKAGKPTNEKTRVRVDCQNERMEILSVTKYDSKGNVLDSSRKTAPYDDWTDVIPGSVGQRMYESACAMIPG